MVALAELEIFCSRPHAPTRRLALGRVDLPVDPAPGPGGILLGGVVARFAADLTPELVDEIVTLVRELERGRRIAQPRLRHRLQIDTIGLDPARHRLVDHGDHVDFEFATKGSPSQHVLGAIYAAAAIDRASRPAVLSAVKRALRWYGPVGPDLVRALGGARTSGRIDRLAVGDPTAWALHRLGFSIDASTDGRRSAPSRDAVQRRYRELLRAEHPDHGADAAGAAERIAELGEARRILIGR